MEAKERERIVRSTGKWKMNQAQKRTPLEKSVRAWAEKGKKREGRKKKDSANRLLPGILLYYFRTILAAASDHLQFKSICTLPQVLAARLELFTRQWYTSRLPPEAADAGRSSRFRRIELIIRRGDEGEGDEGGEDFEVLWITDDNDEVEVEVDRCGGGHRLHASNSRFSSSW